VRGYFANDLSASGSTAVLSASQRGRFFTIFSVLGSGPSFSWTRRTSSCFVSIVTLPTKGLRGGDPALTTSSSILRRTTFYESPFSLLQTFPKPTASGLTFVGSEEFRVICERIVATCVIAELPESEIERRLRYVTVSALLPKQKCSAEEVAEFYAEHWRVVDAAWKRAITRLMVSPDFGAAIADVIGVPLPEQSPNTLRVL
jgi:hypothetical protein